MRNLRIWLPGMLLAGLMSAGCFLISGQFLVTFEFDSPITISGPSALLGQRIDLTEESDYNDNKDKLEDVADVALLGKVTNLGASATNVEIWMIPTGTATSPLLTTETAVKNAAGAVKVWGSLGLAAGQSKQIDWNASAQLFGGRAALINEIKGDGQFHLYAFGTGAYNFRIENGALVALLTAKK